MRPTASSSSKPSSPSNSRSESASESQSGAHRESAAESTNCRFEGAAALAVNRARTNSQTTGNAGRGRGRRDVLPLPPGSSCKRDGSVDPPHMSLSERLALRPVEAARALGIGERTLRALLPELPHVRAGGVVLLPVEALREWLRSQVRIEASKVDEGVRTILDKIRVDTLATDE